VARTFASGDQVYDGAFTGGVTGAPFTMVVFARIVSIASKQVCMGLNSGSESQMYRFRNQTGGTMLFQAYDGSFGTAETSTAMVNDVWVHVAGVETSSSSRAVYLDGGGKGTNTTSKTPSGIVRTDLASAAGSDDYVGSLGGFALWNAALTDDEVLQLANGFAPSLIRPAALRIYLPLFGNGDPAHEQNVYHTFEQFSQTGTPTHATHPPKMIYPVGPI
jgi:hypothetical protein